MKVMLVGYPFLNRRQWNLAYSLKTRGCEISLIVPDKWYVGLPNKKYLTPHELLVHFKPGLELFAPKCYFSGNPKYYFFCNPKEIMEILQKNSPQIIYVHTEPTSILACYMVLYKKRINSKFIIFSWENLYSKMGILSKKLFRISTELYDLIVAGSISAKKALIKRKVSAKKIICIPQTGVDTELFKPRYIEKNGEICRFLFAGRFAYEKGIHIILKAYRRIFEKYPKKCMLILCGDGPLRKDIERYVSKNEYLNIRIIPYQDYKDMPKIYNSADVFLYPSIPTNTWTEQFGYSVVEAMASGLPVIVSNVGALNELVKHKVTGFVVPSGSTECLYQAMKIFMENPYFISHLGSYARQYVLKYYSLNAITEKLISLFKEIC